MVNEIVSDASPLIAFGRIGRLDILFALSKIVFIPESVANECTIDQTLPGARNIQNAIHNEQIIVRPDITIQGNQDHLLNILGNGEAAAIRLAKSTNLPLLIDEKLGRGVAESFEIAIIGTGGILLLAKKNNIISKVKPILSELQKNGYRLSDELISIILNRAKE